MPYRITINLNPQTIKQAWT